MSVTIYESPIGPLTLSAGADGLQGLHFPARAPGKPEPQAKPERGPSRHEHDNDSRSTSSSSSDGTSGNTDLAAATDQLDAYFAGQLQRFDLTLDLRGTPFQRQVWALLTQIPYGTTTTYGAIAHELAHTRQGRSPEARAVGGAVGRSPRSRTGASPVRAKPSASGKLARKAYSWKLYVGQDRHTAHKRHAPAALMRDMPVIGGKPLTSDTRTGRLCAKCRLDPGAGDRALLPRAGA